MKTVALTELTARRDELLGGLARGETFAVTDAGREVAMLTPPPPVEKLEANVSAYDLVADLIGAVDGPPDLSNKKKHLGSFGLE